VSLTKVDTRVTAAATLGHDLPGLTRRIQGPAPNQGLLHGKHAPEVTGRKRAKQQPGKPVLAEDTGQLNVLAPEPAERDVRTADHSQAEAVADWG
jgi:hypothetical protein